MQKLKRTALIQFNYSFKKETEMEDGQDRPLQCILVEIVIMSWISNIRVHRGNLISLSNLMLQF